VPCALDVYAVAKSSLLWDLQIPHRNYVIMLSWTIPLLCNY